MKLSSKIILASESPRRKDLLNQLCIKKIECIAHNVDEGKFEFKLPISKSVSKLVQMKAESVRNNSNKDKTIISGDTIVFRTGKIFHKTYCKEEVKNYLRLLSSKKHFVYGGLCVISPQGKVFKRIIRTEVYFNKIEEYDLTNEVLEDGIGKAGGYAIQNFGSRFIKKIRGCYTNIVGISIPELYKILKSPEF